MSNALLMSSATVTVRTGGLSWLKPVAMVPLMLCSACRVIAPESMLPVMYGSSVFSSASLREVRWVCTMRLCSCPCLALELCLPVSMHEG